MRQSSASSDSVVAVPPLISLKVLTPSVGSPSPSRPPLDASPVFYHDILSPWDHATPQRSGGKRLPSSKFLPDGLMSSPSPLTPPRSGNETTVPRMAQYRSRSASLNGPSLDRSSESSLVTKLQQVVFFSSSPETRVNGHSFGASSGGSGAGTNSPSLLKQKQIQRMAQLQFEHPSVNVTPQRLSNPNGVLRDILNANFTSVKHTPKPPGTVPRRTEH